VIAPPRDEGEEEVLIPAFDTAASREHPQIRARKDGARDRDDHGIVVLDTYPDDSSFDPEIRLRHEHVSSGGKGSAGPSSGSEDLHQKVSPSARRVAEPCPVWAVIVDGDNDISDTFDEDAAGMYAVLRGHRVPRHQIYYFNPHLKAPDPCLLPSGVGDDPVCEPVAGCQPPGPFEHEQRTSYCRLRRVMTEYLPTRISASAAGCDELLFFFSSHGVNQMLKLVSDKPYGAKITTAQLDAWLAGVPCKKVTVVIEACKSGWFAAPPMSPSAKNPQQQRVVFTSTTKTGVSHQDIDSRYDSNPGDVGSETIWGYIEAFGTGSADRRSIGGSLDERISFSEAVAYARANDASIADPAYQNDPQVAPAAFVDYFPHSVYPETFSVESEIDGLGIRQRSSGGAPAQIPQVSVHTDRRLVLTVRNTGPSPLDVATVRVYLGQRRKPVRGDFEVGAEGRGAHPLVGLEELVWWPFGFSQIGNTVLLSNMAPGQHEKISFSWRQRPDFGIEGEAVVLATVDGPKDPVTSWRMLASTLLETDDNVTGAVIELSR
jgi:hypothetical protein